MDVFTLASSSAGNAHLVTSPERPPLLLDAGLSFSRLQRAIGFGISRLGGALITHEHADHSRAVPKLLAAGVDVFASRGTLDALGVKSHRAHVVEAGAAFGVGSWLVMPIPAIHDAAEPLSFFVRAGPGRLLYVTDTGYCPFRFLRLTHVLVEANYSEAILSERESRGEIDPHYAARVRRNHLSIEACVDLLRANDLSLVEEIVLLHMSGGNSDAEAFALAARRASGRPVRVAAERVPA